MDEKNITEQDIAREERRKFLKNAGAFAAAAPAAALLLSAKAKAGLAVTTSAN
ncbi:MAG: hypothetical protein VCD66_18225 [Alphaproteobacteria bacterium]|jgi:hypothetical protein